MLMSNSAESSITKICKRSGDIAPFEREKIVTAINKSAEACDIREEGLAEKLTEEVIKKINQKFHTRSIPAVEEVQDIVEEVLIENSRIKMAKAYIIYREQHRQIRDITSNEEKLMEDYLGKSDWRLQENSNMSFSLQGLNNYVASSVSAQYWLNKLYPENVREAHINGDFHIHDLGLLAPYCCGWDLKDLLTKGFQGVKEKIQSKPPKHFKAALGQIVNFFYTLQGEAAGAQAFANFDTYLAPFIRYDDLSYKEVKQSLQEFMFNINIPTRVGFQTPFTNVTLDVSPTKKMGEENVIFGGEVIKDKYKDFQKEMDIFNKAFAEILTEGDSTGRPFSFPIPTYNLTEDFDWNRESLKPMWDMTAKYGIPYFSNFINSDMDVDDARSMCCRLRLDNRELRKRGGGLFGSNPLTGSVGVVTMNMPRLGYRFRNNKEGFFRELTYLMDMAKQSLEIKRKMLEKLTEQGLYPYSKYYLEGIKKKTGNYWTNHFSTIGLIGMNESVMNFMDEDITTPEGRAFTLEVLGFMRDKLQEYQKETGNNYNLEATPAEGTSYRLARIDREKYPDIKAMGENEPYYTNSTQLPVFFTEDVFKALQHQDDIQTKYTGGTVFHIFLGERL